MSEILLRNGTVLRRAFCPASCGTLVLAAPTVRTGGHHVLWVHPDNRVRSLDPRRGRDPDQALADFKAAASSPRRPSAFQRDWQKERVYEMEDRIFDRRRYRMTKNHMIDIVERICADYDIDAPEVDVTGGGTSLYIFDNPRAIEYGSQSVTHAYHEVAHHIEDAVHKTPKLAHHGPRFVRILFDLLHHYEGIDLDRMETIAGKNGVIVSPASLTARQTPNATA